MAPFNLNNTLSKRLFILFFFSALLPIIFSACEGRRDIHVLEMVDTVENCSAPFEVSFYSYIDHDSPHVNFEWDFGDGATSGLHNPTHTYHEPGLYKVNLTISNKKHSDTKSLMLDLRNQLPVLPDFEYQALAENYRVPSEIIFRNKSLHATSYFWNFGDGKGSKEKSPTHIFTTAGTYEVTLQASCNSDTAYYSQSITISPAPEDIRIEYLTLWLPEEYANHSVYYQIYFGIHNEASTYNRPVLVEDIPFTWDVNEEIFFFNGDYDQTRIIFEIWDESDIYAPLYRFDVTPRYLYDNYYPTIVSWDEGNGFGAEVEFSYW